ncbi:MAG: YceI family protein [Bacteroidota bacterium]|jgi:polyisoprenoid-binding protein YceI
MNPVKPLMLAALLILVSGASFSQTKYFTRDGSISFYSKAALEDFEATNKKVTCVVDPSSGQMEFTMLMRAFEFEKELMKEHFNENYLESEKFPKSTFKGNIENAASVKWTVDGAYPVKVTGKMTIHGVTKDINASGTFIVKGGKVSGKSEFMVALADYNIKVEKAYTSKIADKIKVTVDVNLEPLAK